MTVAREAVALLSGGLDSTVACAAFEGRIALALTADYGQAAAPMEISAARAIADRLGAEHKLLELRWLGELAGGALSSDPERVPDVDPASLDEIHPERTAAVWVPNRNALFVAAAAAFAEKMGAEAVLLGLNREEGMSFPDNTAEFMAAASRMLRRSTLSGVKVESPTAGLDKTGIVRLGLELGAPLAEIWSCYRAGEKMCGRCESCRRLLRALERANCPPPAWPRRLERPWTNS